MYNFLTPSTMLRELLIDRVTGLLENNTFVGNMPATPNFCVCVYDSGGEEQIDRLPIDEYSLQIRTRGNYTQAYSILNDIKLAIQSIPCIDLNNGTHLIGVWIKTNIANMGRDNQDRSMFSLNIMIKTQPSIKAHRGGDIDEFPPNVIITNDW